MLSIQLPQDVERRFQDVVQKNSHGNVQVAIASFLKLQEKYGWKEQFLQDVESIRAEVHRNGGVTSREIDATIHAYRKNITKCEE